MAAEPIESLPASAARARLAELLNLVSVRGDRIVLERHGKRVAALIPMDDLDLLERLEDRLDIELAKEALAESDERISSKELRRRLGL
jgi:prevent-host-death family protein